MNTQFLRLLRDHYEGEGWCRKPNLFLLKFKLKQGEIVNKLLLIERIEKSKVDDHGKLIDAKIEIRFFEITGRPLAFSHPCKGTFYGAYERICEARQNITGRSAEVVSLSSSNAFADGAISIDSEEFRGRRLGTYLMDTIVAWAQQWPDADVKPVKLFPWQTHNENLERRNRFYRLFGFNIRYSDEKMTTGASDPMKASDLIRPDPKETWERHFEEINLETYLNDLVSENRKLSEDIVNLSRRISSMNERLEEYYNKPLRTFVTHFFSAHWEKMAALALLGALCLIYFNS
jgi:GNAT superfamily N-acetyltransferase